MIIYQERKQNFFIDVNYDLIEDSVCFKYLVNEFEGIIWKNY